MRYAKIISNDYINGEGVCVSFWTQGCPHHCVGCHNPETWSLRGGIEDSEENIINTNFKTSFETLDQSPLL
mgnify:CR=1 FL=1